MNEISQSKQCVYLFKETTFVLQIETLAQILQLAQVYHAITLKDACLSFAYKHLPAIMSTDGFNSLIVPNKELLVTPSLPATL